MYMSHFVRIFKIKRVKFFKGQFFLCSLIGQVAADNSAHRWFHKEFNDQEHNSSAWKSIGDWVSSS